ncbi:MAG: hypothetical protein QMD44_11240 [Thermodesulfovibrionales bacterium]|jgi:hypothetical protein|nr:hypothetical protein [Thermodesulfovibrionales bacterium]
MEGLKEKVLYSAIGASGGLTGLISLSKCPGNTCTSCFGCAGIGIGILLIALINKKLKGGQRNNGMA